MKDNLHRFERENELSWIRRCIQHTMERAAERLGIYLDEYEVCELAEMIKEGHYQVIARATSCRVWVRVKLDGKIFFALYNERMEITHTVITRKMMYKSQNRKMAYAC